MDYKGIKDGVRKYFSLNKFRYVRQNNDDLDEEQKEKKKKHNKLSYCDTCKFLRPPRSFHCAQCGVCIEVHDHHCPWVGTCIGYRNLKYFIAFLFWCGFNAVVDLSIMAYIMWTATEQMTDPNEQVFQWCIKL